MDNKKFFRLTFVASIIQVCSAGYADSLLSLGSQATSVMKALVDTEQQTQYAHSCSFNIDRIAKEPSVDYRQILRNTEGGKFTDTTFPTNDLLYWPDRPSTKTENLLQSRVSTISEWKRLSDHYPKALLFGEGGLSLQDTFQSQKLGNCYYIAGAVAYAENEARFLESFVVQATNVKGIYVFNVYVAGKPETVVIDDILPFEQTNQGIEQLVFAKPGIDGAMWGPLLEKLWSKIHGCYELTASGWQHESLRMFTGAPAQDYVCESMTVEDIWKTISEADAKGYIMGGGTPNTGPHTSTNSVGLNQSHAYSIIGAYQLKDQYGKVVEQLFLLRNPWGKEQYVGKWYDNDPRWTSGVNVDYKDQVPYHNLNDGMFFMDVNTFKNNFLYFVVTMYQQDWKTSYYFNKGDDGKLKKYLFSTNETMDVFVAADTYDPRMYPPGCKTLKVMAQLLARKVGTTTALGQKYFSDWVGFGFFKLEKLPPGDYEIYLQYAWPADTTESPMKITKDYSVRLYAPKEIKITNAKGETSTPSSHDTTFWQEILDEYEAQQKSLQMQQQLINEISNAGNLADYEKLDDGFYVQYWGPLMLRPKDTPSQSLSIYAFFEGYSMFDLHVKIAFKASSLPVFEFLEGTTVANNACENVPELAENGGVFMVCQCFILPLVRNRSCSVIVENTDGVDFGYQILGYNDASTVLEE